MATPPSRPQCSTSLTSDDGNKASSVKNGPISENCSPVSFQSTVNGNIKVACNQLLSKSGKQDDKACKSGLVDEENQDESQYFGKKSYHCFQKISETSDNPDGVILKRELEILSPVNWSSLQLPKKRNLPEMLIRRFKENIKPTCSIQIGDHRFNCHSIVLQCYSTIFDNVDLEKNRHKTIELPQNHVTPSAFALMYDWMVNTEPKIHKYLGRHNILDVLMAAQFLGVADLEEQCWAFLKCKELYAEDGAFLMFLRASKNRHVGVMKAMVPLIRHFFLALVSAEDYLTLTTLELTLILQSDNIGAHCEIEVFMSAIRWLSHAWPSRKNSVQEVMSCVRFALIEPWQLVDIRRNPEHPNFIDIMKSVEVQQMVDDGLAYAIAKYWYGFEVPNFTDWIGVLGLEEPTPRNWLGEPIDYLTYEQFETDLKIYRKSYKEFLRNNRKGKSTIGEAYRLPNLPTKPRRFPVKSGIYAVPPPVIEEKPPTDVDRNLARKNLVGRFTSRLPEVAQTKKNTTCDESLMRVVNLESPLSSSTYRAKTELGSQEPQPHSDKNMECNTYRVTTELGHQTLDSEMTEATCSNVKDLQAQSPKKRFTKETLGFATASKIVDMVQTFIPHRVSRIEKPEPVNDDKPNKSIKLELKNLFFPNREALLVFGGVDPHLPSPYGKNKNAGKDIFRFHLETNIWEKVCYMPGPRCQHSATFLNGLVYIAGGGDPRHGDEKTNALSTFWSFDPATQVWNELPTMIRCRKIFGLLAFNKQVYAIAGRDINGDAMSHVERYYPNTGVWEEVSPLNKARMGMSAAVYQNKIWVAGGITGTDANCRLCKEVERFDTFSEQWTYFVSLRLHRSFGSFSVENGELYLIGGISWTEEEGYYTSCFEDIDVWDATVQQWVLKGKMEIPRHGHSVSLLGTNFLIIGGVTDSSKRALNNVECFSPRRGSGFSSVNQLPFPVSGHASVTLPPRTSHSLLED